MRMGSRLIRRYILIEMHSTVHSVHLSLPFQKGVLSLGKVKVCRLLYSLRCFHAHIS